MLLLSCCFGAAVVFFVGSAMFCFLSPSPRSGYTFLSFLSFLHIQGCFLVANMLCGHPQGTPEHVCMPRDVTSAWLYNNTVFTF